MSKEYKKVDKNEQKFFNEYINLQRKKVDIKNKEKKLQEKIRKYRERKQK